MQREWFVKEYLILIVVLSLFVFLIYISPDLLVKKIAAFLGAGFYLMFGLQHHVKERNMSVGIFIEYFLISTLVLVILLNFGS